MSLIRAQGKTAIFRRLIVLLDRSAPAEGAFRHALDWARHLRLPIHAWTLPSSFTGGSFPNQTVDTAGAAREELHATSWSEDEARINACAEICEKRGVKLGLTRLGSGAANWLQEHLQRADLFILSHAQRAAKQRACLLPLLWRTPAAVLVCPDSCEGGISRMLVLYRSREQDRSTLATATELCRWFRAAPVVLTVARSEEAARRLQQPARTALAQCGLGADFDFMVGSEVSAAAAGVARWRQCQLIVMGRSNDARWWSWWGGRTTERLLGLAGSSAVLALPGNDAPDSSVESETAKLAPTEVWSMR